MCLRLGKPSHIEFDSEGYTTVYKVVTNTLDSWFRREHTWKPGINISSRRDRAVTSSERDFNLIDFGFHVYLYERDAYWEKRAPSHEGSVVIKLKAHKDWLVATGSFDGSPSAVFTKLELTQEEYDRANPEIH